MFGYYFDPTYFLGEDGVSLSDHPAAHAVFSVTVTEEFAPYTGALEVTKDRPLRRAVGILGVILRDLGKLLTHLDELIAYLQ